MRPGSRLPKLLALGLLLLGLLMAPGYVMWARLASGEPVVELVLVEDGRWRTPAEMALAPRMNPVRFVVSATIHPERRTDGASFRIDVSGRGATLLEESFTVEPSRNRGKEKRRRRPAGTVRSTRSLGPVKVTAAGQYVLNLVQTAGHDVPVEEVTVDVRQHTRSALPAIWGTGVALVAVGLAWLVVLGRRGS